MATDTEERIMVVIGSTGSGKSSICNVLAGNQHDGNLFPASSSMKPCTNKTTAKKVYWRGDAKKPFTLIDTPGLNDPEPGRDSTNISEMADELKKLSHVNVFLIVFHGGMPRFDSSLITMLKLFKSLFGKEFL